MRILAIPKKKKRICAVAFSPSGRDLAAARGDGKIRVWDTTTGDIRNIGSLQETSLEKDDCENVAILGRGS